MKLVALFCVERDEGGEEAADAFLERMIETCIPLCKAADKSVRFRAAGLLSGIMQSLDTEAELSADLLDSLAETMRDRLRDRAPEVRQQAARTLSRLQARSTNHRVPTCACRSPGSAPSALCSEASLGASDVVRPPFLHTQTPDDDGDYADSEDTRALLAHLEVEKIKEVRRYIVASLPICPTTLPAVLDRTRDVAEAVRAVAYKASAPPLSLCPPSASALGSWAEFARSAASRRPLSPSEQSPLSNSQERPAQCVRDSLLRSAGAFPHQGLRAVPAPARRSR